MIDVQVFFIFLFDLRRLLQATRKYTLDEPAHTF